MDITCDQPTLRTALETAGRAIDNKSAQAQLHLFKLSTGADFLSIMATNGHMSIATRVPATIATIGSLLIPAEYLTSYVATLPQVPVTLENADHVCTVSASTTTAEFDSLDVDDYPEVVSLPGEEYTPLFTVESATLRFIIAAIHFAADPHSPSTAFTSIAFLPTSPTQLDIVCADSFHMGHCTLSITHGLSAQLLLHVKDMNMLAKCLRDDSTPVTMYLRRDQNTALFVWEGTTVMTVAIGGKFPSIAPLYSDKYTTTMTLPVENLLPFLNRATIFTEHRVLLRLEPTGTGQGILHISTPYVNGVGRVLDSTLPVEMTGAALELYFKSDQLQEILQAIRHGVFTLSSVGETRPVIITPAIEDVCPQHYSIMPLLRQAALR